MNNTKSHIISVSGIILVITGFFILKTAESLSGISAALPYVLIGLGCGAFGHGAGDIIAGRVIRKNPEIMRDIEITKNDERNVMISAPAKAKAYNMMTYVFGALMVSFALMRVALIPILLLVIAYLFVQGYAVFYMCKYSKEM